jgi:hypothetical protein
VVFWLRNQKIEKPVQYHDMKRSGEKCRSFFFEPPRIADIAAREFPHFNVAKGVERKRMPVTRWVVGFWIQPIGKS